MKERPRARNQRVSNTRQRRQQHLLDVKVRSHKAVQHRNHRLFVIASKVLLSALVCGSLFFGIRYGAKRLFFENPDYRLSKIEVQTDGTLQREQVLKTAELREGENIFSVNLARVRDLLAAAAAGRRSAGRPEDALRDRHPDRRAQAGRMDHDRSRNAESVFSDEAAFLVDARGVLMQEKKLLPGISRPARDHWLRE